MQDQRKDKGERAPTDGRADSDDVLGELIHAAGRRPTPPQEHYFWMMLLESQESFLKMEECFGLTEFNILKYCLIIKIVEV